MQDVNTYVKNCNCWGEVDTWLCIYALTSLPHGINIILYGIFSVSSDWIWHNRWWCFIISSRVCCGSKVLYIISHLRYQNGQPEAIWRELGAERMPSDLYSWLSTHTSVNSRNYFYLLFSFLFSQCSISVCVSFWAVNKLSQRFTYDLVRILQKDNKLSQICCEKNWLTKLTTKGHGILSYILKILC